MKRLLVRLIGLVVLSFTTPLLADDERADLCDSSEIVFGFFNGVQTTVKDAVRALDEFRRIHGKTSPQGDSIRYELLYNYSAGFEDFVETFEQRLQEHDKILEGRYELFLEALYGGGPWWDDLIAELDSAANLLSGLVDWHQAQIIQELTNWAGDPPTVENYTEHQARIDTWTLEGNKLLFVAHSQGNLFANSAYDYATTLVSADSVAVVHIAPASPTLSGKHTLTDLDLVINGLRLLGQVPPITDTIPGYLLRPPGIYGQKDVLGHGLIEIYLNPRLEVSGRVFSHIEEAMHLLIAPRKEATPGFFTVTLTWDGTGDVDLHTFEPTGSQVFYYAPQGASGYLDVDNVDGFGPEHYLASCDPQELESGSYIVALANYAEAEGRSAIIQVASAADGVLATKSIRIGEATEDGPAHFAFEILVSADESTGVYSVSIVN